jgi:hypothetical protein
MGEVTTQQLGDICGGREALGRVLGVQPGDHPGQRLGHVWV